MTHPLRLVAIGFEPAQAGPLRQAAAALGPDQIAWRPLPVAALQEPAALAAALDQADGLLCTTVLDPADARALSALLAERSRLAFIPVAPNAPDLLSRARLGSFDASAAATPWLHPAARAAAAEGLKLPPVAAPLIQSLAQFAHRLPPEAGDLALLGRVLQAVQNPSPANAHLALQTLRWALRPGSVAEPPWPQRYPRTGFYHPDRGLFPDWSAFEKALTPAKHEGRVMLVCFRPQVIAGDDAHLRALICALEAQSLQVIPWFGALDAAPEPPDLPDDLDLWINASGFTLMGSHARPDVAGGAALLRRLDTPCLAPVPLFGQSLQQWEANRLGIAPMQVAMQVAIPELEGGIAPILLAGRDESTGAMAALPEQAERLARLARRYVDLRRLPNRQKRVAITLFSFPPDQGAVGTAAYLDLFASLHHLLRRMRAEGYTVELPDSPEALQRMLTEGPPVAARYPAARYVAAFPEVERISRCWGRPPGEVLTDGTHFEIQGCRLGNIFIGIQPPFGYEGDPMALLFHPEASPSHAFAAYYTWLAHEYQPHALLHFGTHGALEFMPGKQVGLAPRDYPDRLVGDLPHLYFYCINNPAEGAIARRRSHAALVSYLSPPLAEAGLYGALAQIREEVHRCRTAPQPPNLDTLTALATAAGLDADADPALAQTDPDRYLDRLAEVTGEIARALIPLGLHVAGEGIAREESRAILRAALEHDRPERGLTALALDAEERDRLIDGNLAPLLGGKVSPDQLAGWGAYLTELQARLEANDEVGAILRALSGGYIPPGPGGDPVREPETLPTGRNLHAVNPYKIPTPAAIRRGRALAEQLLAQADRPESVALVLWGIDNIKTGGEGIAQAFALLGVEPEVDSLGRMLRFRILPLDELGRPRIDVVITASGIFRDLFPTAMDLLDEAIRAVAALDEPPEQNHLRAHALRQAAALNLPLADAAARIFTTPAGQYGAGVNRVVEAGAWEDRPDLGHTFLARMAHAHGRSLPAETQRALLAGALAGVTLAFQNIDSAEISLADVDHYYEYLGGVSAAVRAVRGDAPRALVADSYRAAPTLRPLEEALRLESRTRLLNPRWYEAMLKHGYVGVNQVAVRLENTFGWAATTGAVDDATLTAAARTFLFDETMRRRLAGANPRATLRMADRLAEAAQRGLWAASAEERTRLEAIGDELDTLAESAEGATGGRTA